MIELKQWRSIASDTEILNRELRVNLKAAQLSVNALQQEKKRMKENYRQNAITINFFRTKAV
jgi:hypothetical protein